MQPTPYKKELNRKIKDDDDDDDDEEERSMSHSSDGETRMFPADVDVSFVSNTGFLPLFLVYEERIEDII